MPEPSKQGDEEDLIRVPIKQLECSVFWRSLKLDGLILYSWAAPRYLPIAKAVRAAGIPFLVNVDSCGLVSRPANPRLWRRSLIPYLCHKAKTPTEVLQLVSQMIDNLGIYRVARARLATCDAATAVCGVSPLATHWLRREAEYFGRPDLAAKIHYLPHPQLPNFAYRGVPKEKLVLSVARWEKEDWSQKDPATLVEALAMFLLKRPDWRACVIGRGAKNLLSKLKIATVATDRLQFIDFLQPADLIPYYNKASIACWSSRSEGQIGTGAQALCCGCSVVAGNAGTLSCFHHYVGRESGRLAIDMTADALAEALMLEADAWAHGQRDPKRISEIWSDEFHSNKVAARGIEILGLPIPTP